jgi:hypothetical protein
MLMNVAKLAEDIRSATSECDGLSDGRGFDRAVGRVMKLKGKLAGITGIGSVDLATKVLVLTQSLSRGPLDFADLAILQSLHDEATRIINPKERLDV